MQRGPAQAKKDRSRGMLVFLIYPAFLRPAADWAGSVLPWVVTRGRNFVKCCENDRIIIEM
jgi:hypothetical protein